VRDRLTMLVTVGVRTEIHTLKSQVWIGSESDCLLGHLNKSEFQMQMQATKKKKCNVQLERRVSLDILSVKNLAKLSAREMPGVEVGNGDKDLR